MSAEELAARFAQAETLGQKVEVLREAAARLLTHIENQRAGNLAKEERTIKPADFTELVQLMKTMPELRILTENMREVAFAMRFEEKAHQQIRGMNNLSR